jgi:hypothetical protein
MPIQFQVAEIETFFGVPLNPSKFPDSGREQYWLDYSGRILKYSIIIDVEKDAVMISGDPVTPWGGNSMYEIGVPCSSIVTGQTRSSIIGPEGIMLSFYYGDPSDRYNRTLTIIRRNDGDLIVWPSWPYPKGHPYEYPKDR